MRIVALRVPCDVWAGWLDRREGTIRLDALEALARVLWRATVRDKWADERARRNMLVPAAALPLVETWLASRHVVTVAPTTKHRVALTLPAHAEAPRAYLDTTGLPTVIADRLLDGDLRDLRGKPALHVADVLLREYRAARLREPDAPPTWRPVLRIPKGRALAHACGLPEDGPTSAALNDAVWAWAAVELESHRGDLVRLIHRPEAEAAAPGRPAAWLVTAGELLHPTRLIADAAERGHLGGKARLPTSERAWRRLMPWPDVLAPDDWPSRTRDQGDAGYLALALAVEWTEAAGLDHGQRWRDAPGVETASDAGWRCLVERAHAADVLVRQRDRALDTWTAAGWASVEGDRVAPGPKLPKLSATLSEAAALATEAATRKRRK